MTDTTETSRYVDPAKVQELVQTYDLFCRGFELKNLIGQFFKPQSDNVGARLFGVQDELIDQMGIDVRPEELQDDSYYVILPSLVSALRQKGFINEVQALENSAKQARQTVAVNTVGMTMRQKAYSQMFKI